MACEILQRVESDRAFASVLLAAHADELQPNDRALCHELVLGVQRRRLWLDRLMAHYARRDPEQLDTAVRVALWLGLYQLRFLSKIPASAAVNESVNLVRRARLRSAVPFVNAVLRRAASELNYDPVTETADPIERLAISTSHPLWLIERWVAHWGLEHTASFAQANNEPPPVSLRIVNSKLNQPAVLARFESAGVEILPSTFAAGAWRTKRAAVVLQEFAGSGLIYVQDEASQLVAEVLDARPGDKVLDVCAAPGSKTTNIADRLRDGGLVVATDLYEHRLRTVQATAATHGLSNIRCVAVDARDGLPFGEAIFDRVLVDAPCTGTGTLRRNPEIRWRISSDDIAELAERQLKILISASLWVKPGGSLVYSTCSVEPEENERVVSRFLGRTSNFVPASLAVNSKLITESGAARLWPQREGSDGFFIAAFTRRQR